MDILETGEKLEISCSGRYTQADLIGMIDVIAAARARNPELRKCFMDARNADFQLEGIGEFFVGEYAAKRLLGMQISLLTRPGQISKLLENAAYNRGLKFLVAASSQEADAWLS